MKAKPERAAFTEWLTFDIPELSNDNAKIVVRWENLAVPFTVKADPDATLANIRNQLIFSFFAAPGLLHYWLDGHIWKIRSDPELRTYLQL